MICRRLLAARASRRNGYILGVGSGLTIIGGLRLVKNAVAQLHDALGTKVFVGALGPKKRRLAVDVADGVLLTWLTPESAQAQAAELHAAARVRR